jgi:hypothetical protein
MSQTQCGSVGTVGSLGVGERCFSGFVAARATEDVTKRIESVSTRIPVVAPTRRCCGKLNCDVTQPHTIKLGTAG